VNDTVADPRELDLPLLEAAIGAGAVAACIAVVWACYRRFRGGDPIVAPLPRSIPPWGGGDVAIVMLLHMACLLAASTIASGGAGPILAAAGGMAAATLLSSGFLLAGGASVSTLGFRSLRPAEDLRLAVATLAGITPPLLVMAGLLDRLVPYRHPVVDLLARDHGSRTLSAVLLSAVVVAPIAEEFFFRRVLQGWFEGLEAKASHRAGRTPTGRLPVAASALVFALAHLEHGLGWIPLVFFGLAVGWLARQRGSLFPGIVVHALFNAVSVGLLLLAGPAGRS
jgi:membrane protease YdiL (CAAX protease family)